MSELPDGWTVAPLSTLAAIVRGVTYSKSEATATGGNDRVALLRATNIGASLDFNELYYVPRARVSDEQLLRRGDVVVVTSSGSSAVVGKSAELRSEWNGTFGAFCSAIRPAHELANGYVAHFIASPTVRRRWSGLARGSNINNLRVGHLADTEIPVPPVAEQQRIVTAIEEALSKLDAGEAGLRTTRQLLKRMRDAVLAAAVTGRLVAQDPNDTSASRLLTGLGIASTTRDALPIGWAQARVGDVARVGSGTTPQRGDTAFWQDGTVPWVTSGLITRGIITEAREFVTLRAVSETSLQLWPVGSLLVAMYGEGQTRGRCAELKIEATCNQACAAIVLHDDLRPYKDFVRLFFDANYLANRRLAAGGVQPNLNAGLIKDMVLELPPLEEQARIVAEVERQFSFVEACERAVDFSVRHSAALRRSVLKDAFGGRLVPQDPSDEPASVLLERIRAERLAGDGSRGRRRRKKVEAS